jgi:autotransporter-associated beta strand protein
MIFLMRRSILHFLIPAALVAPAFAASNTLSGSGGSSLPGWAWGTTANWSLGALPGANDNAVVAATGNVDVRGSSLGGAAEIQDLSFTGTSPLTLHNNSSSTATVLSLNGGRGAAVPLIACTGDVPRTIAGPGTNAMPQTLGLQFKASGAVQVAANVLSISARISESGGAFGLTKTGAGRLVLSGRNSYTGGTVVNTGVLELNGASGGNGRVDGAVTVAAGAELRVTGGDGTGLGFNDGNKVDSLTVSDGLVLAVTASHVWRSAVTMTGGELRSNGGVSDAATASSFQWGNSTLTTNASATSAVVSGRIHVRDDAGSFITMNVADGAAAADLLVSAALTQSGGKCGLIKQGSGTLMLTGAVNLAGVLAVEAGTLDVSAATLGPDVQFNVSNRAFLKLPASSAHKVFVAGEKLAAGTWGPPGSVAAGTAANESPIFTGQSEVTLTNAETSARERWRSMHFGLFVHYVWGGSGQETRRMDGSPTGSLDEVANGFDAAGFADDLASAGVDYVIFTAWHSNFIPLFNSSAVVSNFGFQRNSSRDVVGDMVTAVKAKGIRVLLYANIGQVSVFYDNRWNDVMEDIFTEMMERYDIDGFFMDENDPGGNMSWDFPRIARAIHLRKPDAVTIQNFYGNLYTWDGAVGESGPADVNLSRDIMWTANAPYAQVIAQTWSAQAAKVPVPAANAVRRSAEGIYRGTVVAAGSRTEGGGILWSAGPYPGNGTWLNPATNQTEFVGRWEPGVLEAMQAAGAYIAPVAESIKGVRPSNSWRPQGFISGLEWGVATRKPDDSREYIHVLNPPATKTLKLPPPNDGKIFINARLLPSGNPVTLVQTPRGVTLTLGAADNWNALNTVIAMDVASQGGRGLTNNDSLAVSYSGTSWSWQKNRGLGEYGDDVHVATADGDACLFRFDGTDVEVIASRGPTRGAMEVFVDDVSQGVVNLNTTTAVNRTTVFSKTNLARGAHTLRLVKRSGGNVAVDAFRVTELIDSADPDLGFGALSNYNNTQTTPNGVGYVSFGANWNYQVRDWTEYNRDIHWAQANGSEATIHFTGTGVVWEGNTQGVVDFYLDGVFVKQTNMGALSGRSNQVGYEISGLPPGNHTLRFVKAGGVYVEFDNFRVYNEVNDQWAAASSSGAVDGAIQTTAANEDFMLLSFDGQSADILARENSEGGTSSVTLDGQSIAASQYSGVSVTQSPMYSTLTSALVTPGQHTLRITKKRGVRLNVDAVRVYKQWPSAALHWKGGGNFNTPSNWLENEWEQWNEYAFGPDVVNGTATLNVGFGSGDLHLLNSLTQDITLTGPNPLIMAADLRSAWDLPFPTGTIHIAAESRNLTINTTCQSAGAMRWNVGAGRTLTLNGVLENWSPNGIASLIKDGPGTAELTNSNTYSGSTIVNGGTLRAGNGGTSGRLGSGSVTIAAGATLAFNRSQDHTPSTTLIGGAGQLVKEGPNVLTLNATLSHTGPTIVQQGRLLIMGSMAASHTTVASGAILGGAGSAAGVTVESGATLSPGTSGAIGTFSVSDLNLAGTLSIGITNASTADRLNVSGTVILGGPLSLNSPAGLPLGTAFMILNKTSPGAISGTFDGRPENSAFTAGGYTWRIRYTGGDGNDMTITTSTLTPLEQWRLTHFGSTADNDATDANNDGEVNLLEYATGQNPLTSSRVGQHIAANGSILEFTYTRSKAAVSSGLVFTVEWSDTPSAGSWSTAGVTQQMMSDDGTTQSVKASAAAGSGRRFIHLRITRP